MSHPRDWLEFVEWYGGDKSWIRDVLLDEGNKFYFIVFLSFILGVMFREMGDIVRTLGDGVLQFVAGVVDRLSARLKSSVLRPDPSSK